MFTGIQSANAINNNNGKRNLFSHLISVPDAHPQHQLVHDISSILDSWDPFQWDDDAVAKEVVGGASSGGGGKKVVVNLKREITRNVKGDVVSDGDEANTVAKSKSSPKKKVTRRKEKDQSSSVVTANQTEVSRSRPPSRLVAKKTLNRGKSSPEQMVKVKDKATTTSTTSSKTTSTVARQPMSPRRTSRRSQAQLSKVQVHSSHAADMKDDAPDPSAASNTSKKRKLLPTDRPSHGKSNRRKAEIDKIAASTTLELDSAKRTKTASGRNKIAVTTTAGDDDDAMVDNEIEEQGDEADTPLSPSVDDDAESDSGMSSVSQPNRSKRLNKPKRQDASIEYDGPKLTTANVATVEKSTADEKNERMQAWLRGLDK